MPAPVQCLLLACGNALRQDDGVGPWLADWALDNILSEPGLRILSRHQWAPELAEDIAHARSVLFLDTSTSTLPGQVLLLPVKPSSTVQGLATHHLDPPQLLCLARALYGVIPEEALLLTVGAASLEFQQDFSAIVHEALPRASELLQQTIQRLCHLPKPVLAPSPESPCQQI
ncbi:MAG TPA: hydrogenase maturation protease [Terracidiphilus sp.]|nr:hydrogenase maturation protease [Terracidiphilus sp.]